MSIVRNAGRGDDWKFVKYLVFDAPLHPGTFEERMAALQTVVGPGHTKYSFLVGQEKCKGVDHVLSEMRKVVDEGGEGLMLRQPGSRYQNGRSSTLLKVKEFTDAEALVVGYKEGTGRLQGSMGGLRCIMPNGTEFVVGSGFSDAQRRKPPKKGSVITFKYQELSDSGSPRFPVFIRERGDVTWDEVKKNAADDGPGKAKIKGALTARAHSLLYTDLQRSEEDKKNAGDAGAGSATHTTTTHTTTTHTATAPAKKRKPEADFVPAANLTRQKSIVKAMSVGDNASPMRKAKAWAILNGDNDDLLSDFSDPDDPEFDAKPAGKKAKKNGDKGADGDGGANDGNKALKDKARAALAPVLPMCKYGLKCYQKNPQHLAKFTHPTRDESEAAEAEPKTRLQRKASQVQEAATNSNSNSATATNATNAAASQASIPTQNSAKGKDEDEDKNDNEEDEATETMPEPTPASALPDVLPFIMTLIPEQEGPVAVILPHGITTLGRNRFGITSPHVSREHCRISADLAEGEMALTPTGTNNVYLKERGSADWCHVSKGESRRVFSGDVVSLLPNHSITYKVKVAMATLS